MLPLQVSVLWCFYNTSAPFLLLWHKLFHNKGLTLLVNFWALASSLIVLAIICIIWIILPTEFEYGQVCRICSPDSCCFSHSLCFVRLRALCLVAFRHQGMGPAGISQESAAA